MNEEELNELHKIINISWKLLKKYSPLERDEGFWNECIHEVSDLHDYGFAGDQFKDAVMTILTNAYWRKYYGKDS